MLRFGYDADHESFRASVRAFVQRELEPRVDEMLEHKSIPRDVWRSAGKHGFLGLEIPEEYGGSAAGDYRFNAVLLEELAKVNMALPSCVGIHADIVAPYLVRLTTDEQKERWLPGVTSGELLTAIAMTEPSAGSDLAALKTTAVRDRDGWIINGSKTFITNGGSADLIVVAARTSPDKRTRGITLFGVEATKEGFSRGHKLSKVGQDESDTTELHFENVRVSNADLIGELDNGFIHLMTFLPQERLGAAVTNLAHVSKIFTETLEYISTRKVFGQAVGSLQHNKFLAADLTTRLSVSQAFIDQCVVAHAHGELTSIDAAKAKLWSSQVQNEVLDHCVQLYGGYGYMNEYRVARAWRDARVTRIWAGRTRS